MSMHIKTWRDPYDTGVSLTKPREIEIRSGTTVLVGCNGSGKSTLLANIEERAKAEKIPVFKYDNARSGGSSSISSAVFAEDYGLCAALFSASEGEAISINVAGVAQKLGGFLKTGRTKSRCSELEDAFFEAGGRKSEDVATDKRVVLLDAIDSGLSVDAVCEVKGLFALVNESARKLGVELYLIVSANEYELACGEECFDVQQGRYVVIGSYEEYREQILKSRKVKEVRIEREQAHAEKEQAKALERFESVLLPRAKEKLKKVAEKPNRYAAEYEADRIKRELRDFVREHGLGKETAVKEGLSALESY